MKHDNEILQEKSVQKRVIMLVHVHKNTAARQ